MKRKIILNLAISLDGYIADENGGYDWITEDGSKDLDTELRRSFPQFLDNVDTVVMGRNCYDQGMHKEYSKKTVYIVTSRKEIDFDNYHFVAGDICKFILKEREKAGKHIYLFGGGILIDPFIKANIIDEYIIGIIPVILGKGRPLFLGNNPTISLNLENYYMESGIPILKYSKK